MGRMDNMQRLFNKVDRLLVGVHGPMRRIGVQATVSPTTGLAHTVSVCRQTDAWTSNSWVQTTMLARKPMSKRPMSI